MITLTLIFTMVVVMCGVDAGVHTSIKLDCLSISDPLGLQYRGTKSTTVTGRTCQRWDAKSPHSPRHKPPNPSEHNNYCRNPDGDNGGMWCYTTDVNRRWERCRVPSCSENCYICNGGSYSGQVSLTQSGKTCQRWDTSFPHQHSNQPSQRPGKNFESNFCRNPDGEQMPWCYTTDPNTRWEYCDMKRCTNGDGSIFKPRVRYTTSCVVGRGSEYRGTIASTKSGKTCAPWRSQSPHQHKRTPENFPCSGLDQNYCRNPSDGEDIGPWCYTTDPNTRWEYCDIPSCGSGNGVGFRATTQIATSVTTTTTSPTGHPTTIVTATCSGTCGIQAIRPSFPTQAFNIEGDKIVEKQRSRRGLNARRGQRILGGDIAVHGSWPWTASLRKPKDYPYCCGVLIASSWVLTVAHCLDDGFAASNLTVKMGHDKGIEAQTQTRAGLRFMMHEAYVLKGRKNDIGLLQVDRPFHINDYVQPACLPSFRYMVPGGSYCVVTGWGKSYVPVLDKRPRSMKQAVIPVLDPKDCQTKYLGWNMLDGTQMCAGWKGAGHDVCKGDSGGPLVCMNGNAWTVQGLTSWGRSCQTMQGNYGAYTRVSYYTEWIKEKMKA